MDENVRLDLEKYLAITDKEFEKIREFVVGDSGEIARLQMCRLAVAPRMSKSGADSYKERIMLGPCPPVFLNEVPGTGKTLRAKIMADLTGGRFSRIQCNPDLRASKVLGGARIINDEWYIDYGPIWANVVLVDEINRADEDTQSAFLEAMGEGTVTYAIPGEKDEDRRKNTKQLPDPFQLYATQNPLEQKGVKPLPEAQLDRFGMAPKMPDYSSDDLKEIVARNKKFDKMTVEPVSTIENLQFRRKFIYEEAVVSDDMRTYITNLTRATHNPSKSHSFDERKRALKSEKEFRPNWEYIWKETKFAEKYGLEELISNGSSPRGPLFLENISKAASFLAHKKENRSELRVLPKDVQKIAVDVLAHRIWLTPTAKLLAHDFGGEYIMRRLIMEHIVENVEW
ncbi:MAG: hypothetical protein A3G49_01385 [Candidatus Sungbacteria bacterium RIFCSPLOWO2_12_FULL_41_11]|uniref:ATPase dynein-related AAA domain-containing protein n=1 Tax=Candidatus Sungbacteria bacterium RIFCSPLOWO2_12_FULL_41_11 TaxID=1802286 RepID=A0A1G2LNU5_9BACT|nr:MAG: MoxR-like protein ATPase [Parcubacteria group bacterium GW2011_GWA2_42_14]OGZ97407.1 MAG: hypothetical protein A3D41_05570 [Candidatus Sungbacteria bacterium RIFCSPHIGHO2_02_FULL_41_12b]OHA13286.1 MAG: hypothetical protein A3G49_01385 [Candidatus Sungbacteria bacterium RIFCSPLOWO2_12_FULL_41_11]